MAQLVPLLDSWGRSTHCDRFHYFYVTIRRCYKGVYVKSFFPCIARLWNSLPIECFPLSYDLNGLKFGNNRQLLNRFPVWFNIFGLLFCVTSCLVVVIQPYTKWILLKKWLNDFDFMLWSSYREWCFSINNNVLTKNMNTETVIARTFVIDHMLSKTWCSYYWSW